jgi:hypothetical protein
MAIIIKNGVERKVKNLGWLIRHANEVETVEVFPQAYFKDPNYNFAGRMIVGLKGGVKYITDWADISVCRDWLKRRRSNLAVCTTKFYFQGGWARDGGNGHAQLIDLGEHVDYDY